MCANRPVTAHEGSGPVSPDWTTTLMSAYLELQLDLFATPEVRLERVRPSSDAGALPSHAEISDDALVAAIPGSGLSTGPALAAEAGRRRLAAAVPALEALCR